MKIRLNKKALEQMPEQIREIVTAWKQHYHKTNISVQYTDQIFPQEDSKLTVINLITKIKKEERTAGEFAGYTHLSPSSTIPLPAGIVAVETGFFCGTPFCTIYQSNLDQIKINKDLNKRIKI